MGLLWLGHKKPSSFHLIHQEQSSLTPKTAIWKGHMYTAPVDSPRWACPATVLAQAPDVTKEAMLEVDLPGQMVRVIFKLDCLWLHHIYHTYAVKSVLKEHQHLLLYGGATVSTQFTDISVLERRPVAIQAPGHPLTRDSSEGPQKTNNFIRSVPNQWRNWAIRADTLNPSVNQRVLTTLGCATHSMTPALLLNIPLQSPPVSIFQEKWQWLEPKVVSLFKSVQAIIFYQVVQRERTRQVNPTL